MKTQTPRKVFNFGALGQECLPKFDESYHAGIYLNSGINNLLERREEVIKDTSHLTIFVRGTRAKGKFQMNDYHHWNSRPSLSGRTSSVSLIFTHPTHRNVKNVE